MATELHQRETFLINDARNYLDQFQFNLINWQEAKGKSDQILGEFIMYSSVLWLSNPEVRQQLGIETIEFPKTNSPAVLITDIVNNLTKLEYNDRRPEQELFVDSHLFIPYLFPYVLKILEAVDLQTDAGLKALAYQALDNVKASVAPAVKKDIIKKTPTGTFVNQAEASNFLYYMADNFRESFGKTKATMATLGQLSLKRDLILTQNIAGQTEVIKGLRDWFKQEEPVSLERAQWLADHGYIKETPEQYLHRREIMAGYEAIIYKELTS